MAERVALDSSASDECLIAVRDSHTGSFNDASLYRRPASVIDRGTSGLIVASVGCHITISA